MTRTIWSRAARCNTATGRHLAASTPAQPLGSGVSTLDSIQCHSISQCNAHAAAYPVRFAGEMPAVSNRRGAALPALSVPRVTGASIKARARPRARIYRHVGEPLLYTDFIFQLHFVARIHEPARRRFRLENRCPRRDCQRANVAPTTVTIDLCALASAEMVSPSDFSILTFFLITNVLLNSDCAL